MKTANEFELKIYSDGVIEVAKDTVYLKDDGSVLARERYRQVLEPGQIEEATELLDTHWLNIVLSSWTEEVITTYQENADDGN